MRITKKLKKLMFYGYLRVFITMSNTNNNAFSSLTPAQANEVLIVKKLIEDGTYNMLNLVGDNVNSTNVFTDLLNSLGDDANFINAFSGNDENTAHSENDKLNEENTSHSENDKSNKREKHFIQRNATLKVVSSNKDSYIALKYYLKQFINHIKVPEGNPFIKALEKYLDADKETILRIIFGNCGKYIFTDLIANHTLNVFCNENGTIACKFERQNNVSREQPVVTAKKQEVMVEEQNELSKKSQPAPNIKTVCKFGQKCNRPNCYFLHPDGKVSDANLKSNVYFPKNNLPSESEI